MTQISADLQVGDRVRSVIRPILTGYVWYIDRGKGLEVLWDTGIIEKEVSPFMVRRVSPLEELAATAID